MLRAYFGLKGIVNKINIMAITENSFTADELAAAAQANPAVLEAIKTFGKTASLSIRNAQEEQEFLTNHENQVISRRTSEIANGIEKDIFDVTGIAKNENEKYHDYAKRVLGGYKTNVESMKSELETLKASNPNEADKKRIKQLEDAIAASKNEYDGKLTEKEKEIQRLKTGYEIEKHLSPLRAKYKATIPEEMVKIYEQDLISKLSASMRQQDDGSFALVDESGNIIVDPSTQKAKPIGDILKEKLANIIENNQSGSGTGTGQSDVNSIGGVKKENGKITAVESIPATVKSKVQLTDHLLSLGLTTDESAFVSAFAKFGEKLPLE